MDYNQSIVFALAMAMHDLSDFMFVNMTNITLATCDSYLDHLKSGNMGQETSVTGLLALLMKGRSLTWNLPVRIKKNY